MIYFFIVIQNNGAKGYQSNSEDFSINDIRITYIAIQPHCPCVAPILKKNGNNSKEKQ
jgi:hypothetical protein